MVSSARRPTQEDVARRAGVSRGTVSLVLNDRRGRVLISAATREKVVAAARDLGYSPNPVAQMLARGRNRIIGFFTFEQTFPYGEEDFHHRYLVGVEREACSRDFDLLLFTRGGGEGPKAIYRSGMNTLRLADGCIFIGTDPDPEGLQRLLAEGYPFVLIGRTRIAPDALDTVVHDHAGGAAEAARHLLGLGHRAIAVALQSQDTEFIRERVEGCRRAVAEAGDARLSLIESCPGAAELKAALLSHGATALICADRRILPAVRALVAEGEVRVPDELSVALLATAGPEFGMPVSHVDLNRARLGRIAFERVSARIEGRLSGFARISVPCQFVAGATTGPAPRRLSGAAAGGRRSRG